MKCIIKFENIISQFKLYGLSIIKNLIKILKYESKLIHLTLKIQIKDRSKSKWLRFIQYVGLQSKLVSILIESNAN